MAARSFCCSIWPECRLNGVLRAVALQYALCLLVLYWLSMATRRKRISCSLDETIPSVKLRKAAPHEFVLEALASLDPRTRPMFGCLAVYVGEKLVLILRDKRDSAADNGVWLATTQEHHKSLGRQFPSMRSVRVLGKGITGWQVLPADSSDFEEAALRACELVAAKDPRIGKVTRASRHL